MQFNNIIGKIMGFLTIILTLALSPTIYTQNAEILAFAGGLDSFVGMEVVAGFGAFIIIFGLLVSGGIFAIAGLQGKFQGAGTRDLLSVVGTVIMIVIVLAMFTNILTYCQDLIDAAVLAADTIGEVGFGLIPVVIYCGILAVSGWSHVATYRRLKKGGKKGKTAGAYI